MRASDPGSTRPHRRSRPFRPGHRSLLAATLALAAAGTAVMATGCDRPADPPPVATSGDDGANTPARTASATPDATRQSRNRTTPQRPPGPIIADPPVVQFGVVGPDSDLTSNVRLINTSDRPITITRAVPTCQCTSVDMVGRVIPARGTLDMPLGLKTSQITGPKTAQVTLAFDGVPTTLKVGLNAEIAYAVRAVPPFIAARQRADLPELLVGEFQLESTDGAAFRILSVLDREPQFVGFDPETDEPRARYRLRYDLTGYDCATMPKWLIVRTTHPKCEVMDVRVRHDPCTKVQPGLPMESYRINIGVVDAGSIVEASMLFNKVFERPFTGIESLDVTQGAARIKDVERDGRDARLVFDLAIAESHRGMIFLPVRVDGVDRAGTPRSSTIYVYGWVRDPGGEA